MFHYYQDKRVGILVQNLTLQKTIGITRLIWFQLDRSTWGFRIEIKQSSFDVGWLYKDYVCVLKLF